MHAIVEHARLLRLLRRRLTGVAKKFGRAGHDRIAPCVHDLPGIFGSDCHRVALVAGIGEKPSLGPVLFSSALRMD